MFCWVIEQYLIVEKLYRDMMQGGWQDPLLKSIKILFIIVDKKNDKRSKKKKQP